MWLWLGTKSWQFCHIVSDFIWHCVDSLTFPWRLLLHVAAKCPNKPVSKPMQLQIHHIHLYNWSSSIYFNTDRYQPTSLVQFHQFSRVFRAGCHPHPVTSEACPPLKLLGQSWPLGVRATWPNTAKRWRSAVGYLGYLKTGILVAKIGEHEDESQEFFGI